MTTGSRSTAAFEYAWVDGERLLVKHLATDNDFMMTASRQASQRLHEVAAVECRAPT